MKTIGLTRSVLFVPANRPERIDKAVATDADVVIVDLEDAVPAGDKTAVRPIVRTKLAQHRNHPLMVRVNALDTGLTEADLAALLGPGLKAVMLPKTQTCEDVIHMAGLMLATEAAAGMAPGSVGLVALIETALGVENAFAVATAGIDPPRLATLAFGAADFCLDMGIRISKTGEELAFARARIALACRAAGIGPPLDSPYMIDLQDRQAFEADARRARSLGFGGKLCIHPAQVDGCNRVFSPSPEEIAFSEKVVAAFEIAESDGQAAIQVDGRFVDPPVVAQASRILSMARQINAKETR